MFNTFNDGKSFQIGCELAIHQHQANMLVKELDDNLDKKYLRMIESIEGYDGFCINLKDHLITTKDQKKMVELQEAVWEAGEDLFMKLHNLGDDDCSLEAFKPTSSSADDVEQAVNYYIESLEEVGYTWEWNEIEEHFDCYDDNMINQRVQDYKPVYLFTKEVA